VTKKPIYSFLLISFLCVFLVSFWVSFTESKRKDDLVQSNSLFIQLEAESKPHSFKTIKAEHEGKVSFLSNLYPGAYIPALTALVNFSNSNDQEELQELDWIIQKKEKEKKNIEKEKRILKSTLKSIKSQTDYSQKKILSHERLLSLQSNIFNRNKSLYQLGHNPIKNLLNEESKLALAEIEIYKAIMLDKELQSHLNRYKALWVKIKFKLKEKDEDIRHYKLIKEEKLQRIKKKSFNLPYPTKVEEVFTHHDQEVTKGQEILSLRSVHEGTLCCNIPEKYLSLFYHHPVFKSSHAHGTLIPHAQVFGDFQNKHNNFIPVRLFFAGISIYSSEKKKEGKIYFRVENTHDVDKDELVLPGRKYQVSLPTKFLTPRVSSSKS
jgi:hypothetical protein